MFYTKSDLTDLTYEIIGSAIEVHRAMGPGLLESVYHRCLIEELKQRNIQYETELIIPIEYKGITLDSNLRCDLLIENQIALELKSVDKIHPIHEAQLITYMKLLEVPKGLIINFNCINIMREGQKTFVNEYFRQLLD